MNFHLMRMFAQFLLILVSIIIIVVVVVDVVVTPIFTGAFQWKILRSRFYIITLLTHTNTHTHTRILIIDDACCVRRVFFPLI